MRCWVKSGYLTGVGSGIENIIQHSRVVQVESVGNFSQSIWTTVFWDTMESKETFFFSVPWHVGQNALWWWMPWKFAIKHATSPPCMATNTAQDQHPRQHPPFPPPPLPLQEPCWACGASLRGTVYTAGAESSVTPVTWQHMGHLWHPLTTAPCTAPKALGNVLWIIYLASSSIRELSQKLSSRLAHVTVVNFGYWSMHGVKDTRCSGSSQRCERGERKIENAHFN